jgi:hypothetical protein
MYNRRGSGFHWAFKIVFAISLISMVAMFIGGVAIVSKVLTEPKEVGRFVGEIEEGFNEGAED